MKVLRQSGQNRFAGEQQRIELRADVNGKGLMGALVDSLTAAYRSGG